MPKSKRDKKISLTKTDKKGLALKQQIVEDVRRCVQQFSSIYVFTVQNMRNEKMKDLRTEWKPSRFFFGKNKVIALGLGRTPEDEQQQQLSELAACLRGQCGLLFTDESRDHVVSWFSEFGAEDYARSGLTAPETVSLCQGPLPQFPHSIEPYLRQLGLPTGLDRGTVTLLKDHEVCRAGQPLSPEQARLLRLLGRRLATFRLKLRAAWSRTTGFERLSGSGDDGGGGSDAEEITSHD